MRALITFGSAHGGTEGLAQMVADGLHLECVDVDVVPASQVKRLNGYDLVVVGGALYASRWHRAARRFIARHRTQLQLLPVYFFSSGPLDDSAMQHDIPPVKGVQALIDRVGAREPASIRSQPAPVSRPPRHARMRRTD